MNENLNHCNVASLAKKITDEIVNVIYEAPYEDFVGDLRKLLFVGPYRLKILNLTNVRTINHVINKALEDCFTAKEIKLLNKSDLYSGNFNLMCETLFYYFAELKKSYEEVDEFKLDKFATYEVLFDYFTAVSSKSVSNVGKLRELNKENMYFKEEGLNI